MQPSIFLEGLRIWRIDCSKSKILKLASVLAAHLFLVVTCDDCHCAMLHDLCHCTSSHNQSPGTSSTREDDIMSSLPGDLTQSQQDALNNLRDVLTEQGLLRKRDDDHSLLRFLRARGFDVAKAKAMFEAMLEWRKEIGADNIKEAWPIRSPSVLLRSLQWAFICSWWRARAWHFVICMLVSLLSDVSYPMSWSFLFGVF